MTLALMQEGNNGAKPESKLNRLLVPIELPEIDGGIM
jgi:hypothetical protein